MYESYLKKDGENREIVMGEIGSGKHVIAGYVGVDGQVRRIPALGRIDHVKIKIESLTIKYNGADISDSVYVSLQSSTANDYSNTNVFDVYSDASKSVYFGGINITLYYANSSSVYFSVSLTKSCILIFDIRLYGVYSDGHEVSLQVLNQKTESYFRELTFQCSSSWSNTASSSDPTNAETQILFDGAETIYNVTISDGTLTDGKSFITDTVNPEIGMFGITINLQNDSVLYISTYFGSYVIDRDGNVIQITEVSVPDSWGGGKIYFCCLCLEVHMLWHMNHI